jgi:hypothetical protein
MAENRTLPPLLLRAGDVKNLISEDGVEMEIHCRSNVRVLDVLVAVDKLLQIYRMSRVTDNGVPQLATTVLISRELSSLEYFFQRLSLRTLEEVSEHIENPAI